MVAAYLRSRWERHLLWHMRQSFDEYYRAEGPNPLVTVKIVTYNRAELLQRTIESVLRQSYQNFEVVIIGDGCTDDTAERIERLNDPRIRFYNMSQRGEYPENPLQRWMVAGTHVANRANEEAHGRWIFHVDDDDIFEPDHIETLLRYAQENQCELVYSKLARQVRGDLWTNLGRQGSFGQLQRRFDDGPYFGVGHSSVMYRQYLRMFVAEFNVWRWNVSGDFYLWIRMRYSGVRVGFIDRVTVKSPLRPGTSVEGHKAEDRS